MVGEIMHNDLCDPGRDKNTHFLFPIPPPEQLGVVTPQMGGGFMLPCHVSVFPQRF